MSEGTAVVKSEPKPPTLRQQLTRHADKLAAFGVSPEAFIEAAMMATVKNPKLLGCTTESILLSMRQAAQAGLTLGRTAHLVPYSTKVKRDGRDVWEDQCQFIPDYKGLIELACSTGKVVSIRVRAVYEGEDFYYSETMAGPDLRHTPKMTGNGGKIVGAYAIADLRFNRYKVEFMNADEIEAVRSKSKSLKDGDLSDWYARKTVVRRLCKTLPSNKQLQQALQYDDTEDAIPDGEVSPVETPKLIRNGSTVGKVVTTDPYNHGDEMPDNETSLARVRQKLADEGLPNPYGLEDAA